VAGVLGLLTVGDGFIYLALLDSGGFATHWFPVLYVGTNVVYLALAIPLGRLSDRVGRSQVLVLGHLALAGAYVCAAAPFFGAGTTLLALTMLGTFYAATDGVLAALAGRLVPAHVRASGIASAQTVVALARMGSAAAFGGLWFAVGPRTAMASIAVVLVMVVPLALAAVLRLERAASE
jgi:MFS family permease